MSDAFFAVFGILLAGFLFAGEPDAYDKLHAYVMALEACK